MSLFFRASEFDCHDGTAYPAEWEDRLKALCSQLDPIREAHDGRVEVVSGYRSPKYNAAVGGKPHSMHPEGKAADIRPWIRRNDVYIHWSHAIEGERVHAVYEFHELIWRMISNSGLPLIGGVGYYPGKWVHVDIRQKPADGHVARWTGVGVGSEQ